MEKSARPQQAKLPRWALLGLIILTAIPILISTWELTATTPMGENDFVGYWSATYLFHNGKNPYDPALMEITQNTKLETGQGVTIMAWNPPTLFVLLLPLAWFTFLQAKFLWLSINLVIIVSVSLMLTGIYDAPKRTGFTVTLILFALVFPPVVSGFYMGQVTFLVLLGLVTSMWLIKKGRWFWAGMVLLLTSIKPHLVVLPLIYLLVHMLQQRRLSGWFGLLVSSLLSIGILFLFRPPLIDDLIGLSAIAPVNWATPTIGGLLSSMRITESARYLIVLFLPLPVLLAMYPGKFSMELSVAVLTLITIPVTFFGWNYDQSMLLIPISLVFTWLAKSNNSTPRLLMILMIISSVIINAYQRMVYTNDLLFVWVPLFWWVIFPLAWYIYKLENRINEQTIP